MRYLIIFLLLNATASARVINTNDMITRTSYPTKIGGLQNPSLQQLRDAGWRDYVACVGIEGSNAVKVLFTDDGVTYTDICDYETIPPAPEPYPQPDTTVPMVDSNGVQVGTARILVDADTLLPVAVINSASPQREWPKQQQQFVSRLDELVSESEAIKRASQVVVSKTVTNAAELVALTDLFRFWTAGVVVERGQLLRWNGDLYRVEQAHTTQVDWIPPNVPALFTMIVPPGTVGAWVQPVGAQDAYQIGDRVTHNGFTWESTAANNVWEPGVFGWTQI
jgi:hypothetical protein